MAQSVEQLICNLQVMGSSPFTSSRKKQKALTEISVRAFFVAEKHFLFSFWRSLRVRQQDMFRQASGAPSGDGERLFPGGGQYGIALRAVWDGIAAGMAENCLQRRNKRGYF